MKSEIVVKGSFVKLREVDSLVKDEMEYAGPDSFRDLVKWEHEQSFFEKFHKLKFEK